MYGTLACFVLCLGLMSRPLHFLVELVLGYIEAQLALVFLFPRAAGS